MRRDDAPAFREAHPGLHLLSDLAGHAGAAKQRRRDGMIAAIGADLNKPRRSLEHESYQRVTFMTPDPGLARARTHKPGLLSDQSRPAVTVKDCAGREFIAGKEQDGLADITRCTDAANRNARG